MSALREKIGRVPGPIAAAFWIVAIAGLIWFAFGHGFANYDTLYTIVWGSEIADGVEPDYGAPIPPTPHPLQTAVAVAFAPLGDGAEAAFVVLAFLALGALAYLTYKLGAAWFGAAAGLLAAAIVLTREPILSNGVRAYVDLPYLVLVLAALLVETRRPRAGAPVLVLLALAGLLRPEAWLFSGAYVLYLALAPRTSRSSLGPHEGSPEPSWSARAREALRSPQLLGLAAIAASAPLLWALYDLVIAGDALYSLTGTQKTVETLGRDTGPVDFVLYFPRRLGEILREPVLLGAAGGGLLALAFLRRRALLGAAAGALAVGAFFVLAVAGLAIITRYAMLAAVVLAIFCGAGAFGWMALDREHPWRRRWMAFGAITLIALAAFTPAQAGRLERLQDAIAIQERIRDDLKALADSGAFAGAYGDQTSDCRRVTVPNHRPVPLLALWLDRLPRNITAAVHEENGDLVRTTVDRGYFVHPASAEVEENFTLDPNDPGELTADVPAGFGLVAENRSWELYRSC